MVEVAPFVMVAVTTTGPAAVAVNAPAVIVAVPLFTVQTMVLLVAVAGSTIPVRVKGAPTVPEAGTPLISVTATKAAEILIVNSWV